jgi:excisionase family DNA binding protein
VQETIIKSDILTITEVAEVLRCSKAHVCNVLRGRVQGLPKLTHFSLGRRKLVRREWLENWMEQNKQEW